MGALKKSCAENCSCDELQTRSEELRCFWNLLRRPWMNERHTWSRDRIHLISLQLSVNNSESPPPRVGWCGPSLFLSVLPLTAQERIPSSQEQHFKVGRSAWWGAGRGRVTGFPLRATHSTVYTEAPVAPEHRHRFTSHRGKCGRWGNEELSKLGLYCPHVVENMNLSDLDVSVMV